MNRVVQATVKSSTTVKNDAVNNFTTPSVPMYQKAKDDAKLLGAGPAASLHMAA